MRSVRRGTRRRGYAMVTVLIAMAVMLTMVSVSQRQIASVLRVEHARAQARSRDQGRVEALARCLSLLETGLPPSSDYRCATVVDTTEGKISYTVTFKEMGGNRWRVIARPTRSGEQPESMPATFADP